MAEGLMLQLYLVGDRVTILATVLLSS